MAVAVLAVGLSLFAQVAEVLPEPSEEIILVAAEAHKDPVRVVEALRVQDLPDEHARAYLMAVGDLERPRPAPVPSVWARLSACESNGRWNTNTGNSYYGGLQQDMTFWRRHGGLAFAPRPDLATPEQQITVAQRGQAVQGWAAWPACSRRLGLR